MSFPPAIMGTTPAWSGSSSPDRARAA